MFKLEYWFPFQGGFAKCFELIDSDTQEIYAGKVVSKSQLVKPSQKEKMTQEINIQRSLNSRHIVGFYGYFEDNDNIYILLELCRRRVSWNESFFNSKSLSVVLLLLKRLSL